MMRRAVSASLSMGAARGCASGGGEGNDGNKSQNKTEFAGALATEAPSLQQKSGVGADRAGKKQQQHPRDGKTGGESVDRTASMVGTLRHAIREGGSKPTPSRPSPLSETATTTTTSPRGAADHAESGGNSNVGGGKFRRRGDDLGAAINAAGANMGTGSVSISDAHNRTVLENVSTRDSLGGQFHRDFFRDPAQGFRPTYAPRNFGEGGHVEHHHPNDEVLGSALSVNTRDESEHALEQSRSRARKQREYLRETAASRSAAAEEGLPLGDSAFEPESTSQTNPGEAAIETSIPKLMGKLSVRPQKQTQLGSGWILQQESGAAETGLETSDLESQLQDQAAAVERGHDEELMKQVHGTRLHEHFLERRARFSTRNKMRNLNYDKSEAMNDPERVSPIKPLAPVVAPSTMSEAQKVLRQDSIAKNQALAAKIMKRNSSRQDPKLGAELAESIVSAQEASTNEADRSSTTKHMEELGLGRQQALVRDDGPDQRNISMGKNDGRFLEAAKAFADPHSTRPLRSEEDVYKRHDTMQGVDVFTRSFSFDVKKRLDLSAKGRKDPTEMNTIHYGTPVKQQIDEDVKLRQGARGDRPLDYYQEDIPDAALRLNNSYRDVEGFPLFSRNARLEFLEWELFCRYRAHHLQRRQLALLHGLEPKKNETLTERDSRRAKLDQLCESTSFDESKMPRGSVGDLDASVEELRQWFGAFMLPSPTIVKSTKGPSMAGISTTLAIKGLGSSEDLTQGGEVDRKEVILSINYLNKLMELPGYAAKMGRPLAASEMSQRKLRPEPNPRHEQSSDVLRGFNEQEMAMYKKHQKKELDEAEQKWSTVDVSRRWFQEHNCFGVNTNSGHGVDTVDLVPLLANGKAAPADEVPRLTINIAKFDDQLKVHAETGEPVKVDGQKYSVVAGSEKTISVIRVSLEDGSGRIITTTITDFDKRPLEIPRDPTTNPELDPNYYINAEQGGRYHYHRYNYFETQDSIWEERTYLGEEGWTVAHAADLFAGLSVKARRVEGGDFESAVVLRWEENPSFNPAQNVEIAFVAKKGGDSNDESATTVHISQLQVWQCSWAGPGRTVPDMTLRPSQGVRRYVDVKNPSGKQPKPHFLDKYTPAKENEMDSVFGINSLDKWNLRWDNGRADNYRPLNLYHRKDLVSDAYMPKYTPWEYIAIQEADAPMVKESYIRSDYTGTPMIFATNRHWYHKPRPHGYIKNSPNEMRDLMEYVDTVTPWKKAQKIRSHHEIRRHAPIPVWNRHYLALHRNSSTLLPSQLLNLDKATGRVKSLKETVDSYRVANEDPTWVSM